MSRKQRTLEAIFQTPTRVDVRWAEVEAMTFRHKGYVAQVAPCEDGDGYAGVVMNILDTIYFEGRTLEEARQSFRRSVDDCLAWAKDEGREPEKPCSGRLSLRVNPSLHRRLMDAADRANVNLSQFVTRCLDEALRARRKPKASVASPRTAKTGSLRRRAAV